MKRVSVALMIVGAFIVGLVIHGRHDEAAKHPRVKPPIETSCSASQYYDDDLGICRKG